MMIVTAARPVRFRRHPQLPPPPPLLHHPLGFRTHQSPNPGRHWSSFLPYWASCALAGCLQTLYPRWPEERKD